MRTPLEQRVLESMRRSRTILPGSRVGVAVSGGADSVALLRILESLANELGITLLVAHLNHSLRGAESEVDAAFVEKLAKESGLQFVQRVEDVGSEAEREGWNLEDAGRRLRRRFFDGLVAEGRADRIAVAHTADDQAETVLAQVMRGTGLAGLAGIYPVAEPVVRPLLEVRRQDLREYLRAIQQDWREDATNGDTRRMRARIRKDLLPLIERDFSPAIVGHLSELARFAREEEEFWNTLVEERFQTVARNVHEELRIAAADLLTPLRIQDGSDAPCNTPGPQCETKAPARTVTERLIRRLYEGVRGDRRELSAQHVEQVIDLAGNLQSGRAVVLPRAIIVRREFNELVFARADAECSPQIASGTHKCAVTYEYVLSLPLRGTTTVSVAELGKRLSLNLIDWPSAESDTIRASQVLDADLRRFLSASWAASGTQAEADVACRAGSGRAAGNVACAGKRRASGLGAGDGCGKRRLGERGNAKRPVDSTGSGRRQSRERNCGFRHLSSTGKMDSRKLFAVAKRESGASRLNWARS
jgi:tRNA(Ile)-lysidine synthetase-like protein